MENEKHGDRWKIPNSKEVYTRMFVYVYTYIYVYIIIIYAEQIMFHHYIVQWVVKTKKGMGIGFNHSKYGDFGCNTA